MLRDSQIKRQIAENTPALEQARKMLDDIIKVNKPPVAYSDEQRTLIECWDILCRKQIELMTLSLYE